MKLKLQEIAAAIRARGAFDGNIVAQGYSIDSRTITSGELFFAITGERFDGHVFVREVLAKGAAAAVISHERQDEFADCHGVLVVGDPLVALQRLGNHVRNTWGKRVIGLTGSAGKTTTKDATATVLATRFNILKSQGNLNNHFGLPLQLLKLEPQHEVAVIEMGMNHSDEIAALCRIAEPDWAIVTNVGTAHAGNFIDGIEGVARAKRELVENTRSGGICILNGDDVRVRAFAKYYDGRCIFYGTGEQAEVRAEEICDNGAIGTDFRLVHRNERLETHLPLIGRHNLLNALAAAAAGVAAGIPLRECADAISQLEAGDRRGDVLRIRGAVVINDCYNSNPKALNAMVEALAKVPAKRRIVIAGEMLELGSLANDMHRECGAFIAERGIDVVVGVRGYAKDLLEGVMAKRLTTQTVYCETPQEAGDWLAENLREDDAVLLKASRGVRLEGALEAITKQHERSEKA